MPVLCAVWEGLTCSFRYPHFMVGRQPSYPVPPPATIYGMLAAARGGYFDPTGIRMAFCFSHRGSVDDLEHMHLTEAGSGRPSPGLGGRPLNTVANVNPVAREMLVFPRLALYLDVPPAEEGSWCAVLTAPHYPVTLGRSQDLGSFVEVRSVDLVRRESGYAVGTLAEPGSCERVLQSLSLPAWIDSADRRRPRFQRYDFIRDPVVVTRDRDGGGVWVDPSVPERQGQGLAVLWQEPWSETVEGVR